MERSPRSSKTGSAKAISASFNVSREARRLATKYSGSIVRGEGSRSASSALRRSIAEIAEEWARAWRRRL